MARKIMDAFIKDINSMGDIVFGHWMPRMVVAGVGWAKPVSIRPDRFRNPKVGMAVSAAAEPEMPPKK